MSGPEFPILSSNACPPRREGSLTLQAVGLDLVEMQILDLMRLQFAQRADRVPRHAAMPEEVARQVFGAAAAPRLIAGITRVIDEMASARSEVFRYSNPYCAGCARGITPEESNLMQMLHHQRRGHRGRAMVHALMICEARPIAALIEVTAELAILTGNLIAPACDAEAASLPLSGAASAGGQPSGLLH